MNHIDRIYDKESIYVIKVSRCKDVGVKQVLVIGGSREPIGSFDSSIQILETGFFDGIKIGIAGHPEGSPDMSDTELEKAHHVFLTPSGFASVPPTPRCALTQSPSR